MGEKVKEKAWILFGAGDEGKKLALILENAGKLIYAFCDNDERKVNTCLNGKMVLSFEKLVSVHDKYQIVLSVSERYEKQLQDQLQKAGIKKFFLREDIYGQIKFPSNPLLKKYRNRHKGERCFIIGTGPSLRVEDLNVLKIKGEITFASNKIFKIYPHTSWRPDYYCVTDYKIISQYYDEISKIEDSEALIAEIKDSYECRYLDREKLNKRNFNWFRIYYEEKWDEKERQVLPCFSFDPTRYIIDGGISVTYSMIQWAIYMGFSELYLLGIDFFYNDMTGLSNTDHFGHNYIKEGERINPPNLERCKRAYLRAEMLSKENGFKTYNSTRGGKLEVFQRINFDEIFI